MTAPAVADSSSGVGYGSCSANRPGAANASGTLLVFAYSAITDISVAATSTGWTEIYRESLNRQSVYGHFLTVGYLAKLGSASEPSVYTFTCSGANADETLIGGVVYRISNPSSASTLASNFGATNGNTATTDSIDWPSLTLQAGDSVLLSCGACFAASQANANSLDSRPGETDSNQFTGGTLGGSVYYYNGRNGYFSNKSGTLAASTDSLSGNYGANTRILEVRGGTAGGGGRVIVVGL